MNLFDLPDHSEFNKKIKAGKKRRIVSEEPAAASLFFEEEDLWDYDRERQAFIDHMEFLKNQSVYEATLYKKWQELRQFNETRHIVATGMYEDLLWKPRDIFNNNSTVEDLTNIRPRIIVCEEGTEEYDMWKYLRLMIHTFEFSSGIGRLIRYLIVDDVTGKVLGITSLASDVVSLGVRDKWIGWGSEDKFDHKMINHLAIASTIVPTQPFGYNFLGGKLLASLMTTKVVRDSWEGKFGDKLVGITTTSLYGGHSMYQRIPWWKELGKSAGKVSIKPDDEMFRRWVDWLKIHKADEYERCMFSRAGHIFESEVRRTPTSDPFWKWSESLGLWDNREQVVKELTDKRYSVHDDNKVYDPLDRHNLPSSGPKQRLMVSIYRNLGITQTKYEHGFNRGVYFAPLYENTQEFLRREVGAEALVPLPKTRGDIEGVMNWWLPKADHRYATLREAGRIKPEHLYYRAMIQMRTWDEVRSHYLDEVGR